MANEQAQRLRKTMTRQEVKLWVHLRALRAKGFHFRRQSPISSYIVDFECRRARLIVEIDGGQHATEPGRFRDSERDAALERAGYEVLRFWNHEIDRELNAVVEAIYRTLMKSNEPHPAASRPPSPDGEG
jgi:very-short-patch-repair endonuclease